LTRLSAELSRIEADTSVAVVILSGAGRAFCAGADVSVDSGVGLGADDPWSVEMHEVITRLFHLRVPTIAALNGLAVGAGLDLALACDIRLAAGSAWFAESYVNIGFSPDAGATFLLPRAVGASRAAEMIFTGQRVTASVAAEWGLVSRAVPDEELDEQVSDLARRIGAGPPVALGLAKRLLATAAQSSLETSLRNELVAARVCAATADHREGVRAVQERRAPHFMGR
jgi:2-(1,2-epoxy-1,2-dihydrophenyl)acetyl-CoA isomerase